MERRDELESRGFAPLTLRGKENVMSEAMKFEYRLAVLHVDMRGIFELEDERAGKREDMERVLGNDETLWLALEGSGW